MLLNSYSMRNLRKDKLFENYFMNLLIKEVEV